MARSSSVEELGEFKIVSLRYLSYPKCYKTVSEDIWHWAPLTPSADKARARITERKHQLYLANLTYRDTDNLSGILASKMREERQINPIKQCSIYISVGLSGRQLREPEEIIQKCRLYTNTINPKQGDILITAI